MPFYEYKCDRCGAVFEVLQKMSAEPLEIHENCGGALERLLFPPALRFKGTGWYVTDYPRAGDSKKAGKEEGAAPPPAKTESKSTGSSASPSTEK